MTLVAVLAAGKGPRKTAIGKNGGRSLKDDYIVVPEPRGITLTHRFEGHVYKFVKNRFNRRLNPVPAQIFSAGTPEEALSHLNNAFIVAGAIYNASTSRRRRKIAP